MNNAPKATVTYIGRFLYICTPLGVGRRRREKGSRRGDGGGRGKGEKGKERKGLEEKNRYLLRHQVKWVGSIWLDSTTLYSYT